jgi:hypothetical protein
MTQKVSPNKKSINSLINKVPLLVVLYIVDDQPHRQFEDPLTAQPCQGLLPDPLNFLSQIFITWYMSHAKVMVSPQPLLCIQCIPD